MVIIRVLWGAAVRKYIFNQESNTKMEYKESQSELT